MADRSDKAAYNPQVLAGGIVEELGEDWLDQVYALESKCFPRPWPRESIRRALTGAYQACGFCCEKSQLRGYLFYSRAVDEVEILNVGVDPEFRNRGIGRTLLSYMHTHQKALGARKVHLEVGRNNAAALKLYSHLGYQQVGCRKAYYQDRGEDALLFTLVLS